MNNKKSTPLSIEDLVVDGARKATVTKDGQLIIKKSKYEKSLDDIKPLKLMIDNKCMSLRKGLSEDILSKLIIPNKKDNQPSILGTIYMSKKRILVIQSKIWNNKSYYDFRMWYKNDDDNFLPSKKGFMIALSYKEDGKDEISPLSNFFSVIDEIRKVPDEEEIN